MDCIVWDTLQAIIIWFECPVVYITAAMHGVYGFYVKSV